jgi:two-component system nitrogen regulation response regulator GlnG
LDLTEFGTLAARTGEPFESTMRASVDSPGTILIVDDDRATRHLLRTCLTEEGFRVCEAASVRSCRRLLRQVHPAIVVLDLVLPDGDGLGILKEIRSEHSRIPVVLISSGGSTGALIDAARLGARDYLTKPLDLGKLRRVIGGVVAALPDPEPSGPHLDRGEIYPQRFQDEFLGRSRVMQNVFKAIGRSAEQPVTVLISGESGAGKELAARTIWQHSTRASKPFLSVNCATLSESLLDAELFGYEKGMVSHGGEAGLSKLDHSSGGTLFLNEIGELPPHAQAKLLRVLQESQFTRVGGTREIETDVRLIAATTRPLDPICGDQTFSKDLFHRLNGFLIEMPPLRERGDDVRLLLQHFLYRFSQKRKKKIEAIDADASQLLLRHLWPGNVRELQTVVNLAVTNSHAPVITVADLPQYLVNRQSLPLIIPVATPATQSCDGLAATGGGGLGVFLNQRVQARSNDLYAESLEFMERFVIGRVLEMEGGNQSAAARRLGITRGSLRFKLRQLHMSIDHAVRLPKHSSKPA